MPIQLTESVSSMDSVAPPPGRGPVLALLTLVGLAGAAAGAWLVVRAPAQRPLEVDAGVRRVAEPVLDARPAMMVLPIDAGVEAEPDAGSPEAFVPDAGNIPVADLRAAVVPVSSDPPTDVYVDGTRYGKTPIDLELSPGQHTIKLVNREMEFTAVRKLTLKPGDRKPLLVTGAKGTLVLKATPFANITLNGKSVGGVSFKELSVWEGTYTVEFTPPGDGKKEKKTVQVKAGQSAEASVNFLQ
jgi:hypothetical protein